MRAIQVVGRGLIDLRQVPDPEPGPGEVVVRVGGAGLCHTDLTLVDNVDPARVPFTIGHETAGWVHDLGPGVDDEWLGRPVVVAAAWGCGRCQPCRENNDSMCHQIRRSGAFGGGLYRDGGLCEYMLVPGERFLVPLDKLHPRDAAPLADAAATPYHSIRQALPTLRPGRSAVVIGVGGLGHMALQLLQAMTAARTIGVDISEARLRLATQLGATAVVRGGGEDTKREVRKAVGRGGADLVLDFVGSDETLSLSASIVGPGGRIVVIGASGGCLPFTFAALPYEATIGNSVVGNASELAEVVRLAEVGALTLDLTHIPLEHVPQTLSMLGSGRLGAARAVAVPDMRVPETNRRERAHT